MIILAAIAMKLNCILKNVESYNIKIFRNFDEIFKSLI